MSVQAKPDQTVGAHRLVQIDGRLKTIFDIKSSMLRTNPESGLTSGCQPTVISIKLNGGLSNMEDWLAICSPNFSRKEIHRRRAEKTRYEPVLWAIVNRRRISQLLDHPTFHDCDAVRQCQGFDLVVRDVDHGIAEFLVKALDLNAQLRT